MLSKFRKEESKVNGASLYGVYWCHSRAVSQFSGTVMVLCLNRTLFFVLICELVFLGGQTWNILLQRDPGSFGW